MKSKDKQEWRGQPLSARFAARELIWLAIEAHEEVLRLLAEKIAFVEAKGRSDGFLVVCNAGGGKSRIAARILERYPTQRTVDGTIRPAASMELPGTMSRAQLVKQLLKALGDPAWNQGVEKDNLDRAHTLMRKCQLKVLLVDNFQDIPEHRDTSGVRKVGNWFRDLFDDAKIVILPLGTQEARLVRSSNDQVRRRIKTEIEVPYFSISSPEGRKTWKAAMNSLDRQLPLAELSGLDSPWMASRLFFACNGIPGYLFDLIDQAICIAVERGSEKIEAPDLVSAYNKVVGTVLPGENPFADDFSGHELTNKGQYFYDMDPGRRPGRYPDEPGQIATQ